MKGVMQMKEILAKVFPFWDELTEDLKKEVQDHTIENFCPQKTTLHFGGGECAGVQIIRKGQVRVFITSHGGGDITLFRLVDGDVSILSAACMLNGMDVELDMEMETDCTICTIPKRIYRDIYDKNNAVKEYTLEMISEKFSDIMWLFNQFVFSNVASRIASALLEHRGLSGKETISLTHETLAKDAGTAREVVTRILKQFQKDGLVRLTRGRIEILDVPGLGRI